VDAGGGQPVITIDRITRDNTGHLARVADDVFDHLIEADLVDAYVAAPGHALFIALRHGIVVGQVRGCVHRQPDRRAEFYIDNLGVTPSMWRQGIATRLVRAILDWAKAEGCDDFWVATEIENEEAMSFYASLGLECRRLAWYCGPTAAKSR